MATDTFPAAPDASDDRAAVLAAAGTLLSAFAAGDMDGYFGSFAADASFVFHSVPERLGSTAAYRTAWAQWERDLGLRILGCESFDQDVRLVAPGVALFIHAVRVRALTHAGPETREERETIVFVRDAAGRWAAVHEHLSRNPAA